VLLPLAANIPSRETEVTSSLRADVVERTGIPAQEGAKLGVKRKPRRSADWEARFLPTAWLI